MDQQSFNLNANFFNGFSSIFMKLVFAMILVYILIIILNFLRDKFINKVEASKPAQIDELLTLLNKLFFVSGFGFIIGNIFNVIFNMASRNHNPMPSVNFNGAWDYLTFGCILIFIGIGFKAAKKVIKAERNY